MISDIKCDCMRLYISDSHDTLMYYGYWLYFNLKKGKRTRATGVDRYVNISGDWTGIKSELTGFSGQNVFRTCKWNIAHFFPGSNLFSLPPLEQCIFSVAYQFCLAIGLRIQGLQWTITTEDLNSDRENSSAFKVSNKLIFFHLRKNSNFSFHKNNWIIQL